MAKLIVEEFDSLTNYLHEIGRRKPNALFTREEDQHSKIEDDYDWYLTNSYDESLELARNGYKEGLDQMTAIKTRIQHRENSSKNMPSVDVVGYVPHVANAIAGVPKSMISYTKTEQKAKVITILYSFSSHAGTAAEKFVVAGKNLLNVINTLETQGYRVCLNIITFFCGNYQWAASMVQVKHWRQPANPLKMAYPLLHPSFFRRNGFRWLETHPDVTGSDFPDSYGKSLQQRIEDSELRKKWLRQNGLLKANWFFTEFVEARNNEADELIKLMGIK